MGRLQGSSTGGVPAHLPQHLHHLLAASLSSRLLTWLISLTSTMLAPTGRLSGQRRRFLARVFCRDSALNSVSAGLACTTSGAAPSPAGGPAAAAPAAAWAPPAAAARSKCSPASKSRPSSSLDSPSSIWSKGSPSPATTMSCSCGRRVKHRGGRLLADHGPAPCAQWLCAGSPATWRACRDWHPSLSESDWGLPT